MTDLRDATERREVELGLMFGHSLASETARQALAGSTAALALAQLLVERGLIDEQEFAQRRAAIARALQEKEERDGVGLFIHQGDEDKYTLTELPQINCAERVHLCKAACCRLRFPLARQDVEEGVVQWELGRPYLNRQDATGYCVHSDPQGRGCQIYDRRPATCRVFDCRRDPRIWTDFDAMSVNPELEHNLSAQPVDQS